jgi:lysophospholipase L1-like esterase
VVIPLADEFALTRIEISNINEYTDQYNSIIREKESANIGVVEIDEVLTRVNAGIFQDGVAVNGEFVTGGAFSLDGIHLTPRGYAIAANAIIEEINSKFDARISPVIINNHRAVVLP